MRADFFYNALVPLSMFITLMVMGTIYITKAGLPSNMESYTGYLVGASVFTEGCSTDDGGTSCTYTIHERFALNGINSTAHCTVTRPTSVSKKEAQKKVDHVELYTHRTVWAADVNQRICYDSKLVSWNFAIGIAVFGLACFPCIMFGYLYLTVYHPRVLELTMRPVPVRTTAEHPYDNRKVWVDVEMVPVQSCEPVMPDDDKVVTADVVDTRI
jgi:hypothetical protein